MKINRKIKGQQSIEFVLISSLVLLAALATILAFGGKIANFFTNDSSIITQSKKTSPSINSTTRYFSSSDSTPSSSPVINANTVEDVNINIHQDGSASFTVNNQQVNLNPNVMNNLNTVFQTTGSTGITNEVINAIKNMISSNANNYPGQSVPIQISFGVGERDQKKGEETVNGKYVGNVSVNSLVIAVGDTYKIIQKDQQCPKENEGCGYVSTITLTTNPTNKKTSGTVDSDIPELANSAINCKGRSSSGLPTDCNIGKEDDLDGAKWKFKYSGSSESI